MFAGSAASFVRRLLADQTSSLPATETIRLGKERILTQMRLHESAQLAFSGPLLFQFVDEVDELEALLTQSSLTPAHLSVTATCRLSQNAVCNSLASAPTSSGASIQPRKSFGSTQGLVFVLTWVTF